MSAGTMRPACMVGKSLPNARSKDPACGQPAVLVILAEQEVWHAGDVQETILTAYPYCADHAPEEVHEANASTDPSEFLVLELPVSDLPRMVGIINADMFGTPTEPGEGIDWSAPDVLTEAEWHSLLGMPVDEYAAEVPHMIVWEVES